MLVLLGWVGLGPIFPLVVGLVGLDQSAVVPVLCPYLSLTVETHNGTTVFPVGSVSVPTSPVKPLGWVGLGHTKWTHGQL